MYYQSHKRTIIYDIAYNSVHVSGSDILIIGHHNIFTSPES